MHRADYEALVLDTIRNLEGVEDPDDVQEVTTFLHERGTEITNRIVPFSYLWDGRTDGWMD